LNISIGAGPINRLSYAHHHAVIEKKSYMAKPNYAFAKRQRDLAKKQKKEEKRQRKAEEAAATGPDDAAEPNGEAEPVDADGESTAEQTSE
jgi:hypothetical protein